MCKFCTLSTAKALNVKHYPADKNIAIVTNFPCMILSVICITGSLTDNLFQSTVQINEFHVLTSYYLLNKLAKLMTAS